MSETEVTRNDSPSLLITSPFDGTQWGTEPDPARECSPCWMRRVPIPEAYEEEFDDYFELCAEGDTGAMRFYQLGEWH